MTSPVDPIPDAGPRRSATLAISATIAIGFFGSVIVTPLYPLYEERFGFTPFVLTLVYAGYTAGNLVALLVLGRLSDQLGRKRVVLPALAIAAIAGLVFLFATGTAWLAVGRAITGLAVGILSSTGTAWLAESFGPAKRATATVVAATANLSGIALGPLIGGVLAQYGPFPLHLPLIVYLALLAATAIGVALTRDPRMPRIRRLRDLSLRPRVGLPRDRLAAFIAPAVTGFVVFALSGLYFALIPGIVIRVLRIDNVAVGGALVFELGAVAAVSVVLARRLRPAVAMTSSLVIVIAASALVAVAEAAHSLPVLIVASALGGVTLALGYRGSLQVVNEIATDEERGGLASSFLVACFVGNSVPVIGIGVLSMATDSLTATVVFAAVLAVLAVVAVIASRFDRRPPDARAATTG